MVDGPSMEEAVINGAKPHTIQVSFAGKGDGRRVEEVLRAALPEADQVGLGRFAEGIDLHGGTLPMPAGEGRVLVARAHARIQGALFLNAPQKWLASHPPAQREALTWLFMEVEALAVVEEWRGGGIGLGLLGVALKAARNAGTQFVVANVSTGNRAAQLWYRRQGFTLLGRGEPLVFSTRLGPDGMDEPGDGFRMAVRPVDERLVLRRGFAPDGGSYWAPHRVG